MGLLKAWLAGALTTAILGGLFHGVLAAGYLEGQLPAGATMPGPGLVFWFVAPVTLIMAYLYPKGYEGGEPAVEGARFGALIGLILALPLNVLFVGMFDVGMGALFVDLPWHVVEQGAAGAAIGIAYGKLPY